jgi:hypothetical protein
MAIHTIAYGHPFYLPFISGMEMSHFTFQQDGALPHSRRDLRSYLDEALPSQWIGRRGTVEFLSRSPDLTPTFGEGP